MPDETSGFSVSNVYVGTSNEDGVVRWEPLSGVASFDIAESDDTPYYDSYIFDDPEPMEITFRFPWWSDAHTFACKVLGYPWRYKPKYTIRRLRRGGKSHRGKR